jgi:hypothetical protein
MGQAGPLRTTDVTSSAIVAAGARPPASMRLQTVTAVPRDMRRRTKERKRIPPESFRPDPARCTSDTRWRETSQRVYAAVSTRLDTVVVFPTGGREVGRLIGRRQVSVEHFRRRADECRRLAIDARNASDKAFWLGLVARWQALETRETQQPPRDKSRTSRRRQSELASAD